MPVVPLCPPGSGLLAFYVKGMIFPLRAGMTMVHGSPWTLGIWQMFISAFLFSFDFQLGINREQIMELATMRLVENKENAVFLGTPGFGKTHLAVALGMMAAQHRYSTYYINCVFTSSKAFPSWNEVFSDITIASAILDRILHHCQVISIKGKSYRLKERKEMMSNTNTAVNTLFGSGS